MSKILYCYLCTLQEKRTILACSFLLFVLGIWFIVSVTVSSRISCYKVWYSNLIYFIGRWSSWSNVRKFEMQVRIPILLEFLLYLIWWLAMEWEVKQGTRFSSSVKKERISSDHFQKTHKKTPVECSLLVAFLYFNSWLFVFEHVLHWNGSLLLTLTQAHFFNTHTTKFCFILQLCLVTTSGG